MNLQGKSALVTGAGRRLGREIALALADRGAAVALHYRRSMAGALGAAADINARGGRAIAVQADVSRPDEVARMVEGVELTFRGLHILVTCAAVFPRTPWGALTPEKWRHVMATNLDGTFYTARAAGEAIRRSGGGKIVTVGDVLGLRPSRNYLAYAVSKAAVVSLTQCLAKALAPSVQVNCVCPGTVLLHEGATEEEAHLLAKRSALRRIGTPEDVVRAVLFLCEGTDFATGSVVLVDGGRSII